MDGVIVYLLHDTQAYSLEAQERLCFDYARKMGLTVEKVFTDVETAKCSGRTRFDEMVKFLRREQRTKPVSACRVVVSEKTDRLYRNFIDLVTLDVDEMDIEVHLVKENTILCPESRSHEKLIHGIKVVMAKNYIDNLKEESQKGMLEKAAQGVYPGQVPLGYLNVELAGKRGIVSDPERAPLITKLFMVYATGDYSLLEVTRMINAEGLTFRRSRASVPKSTVHSILQNPIYYGDFSWNGKLYHGTHQPLISREIWEKVQDVLAGRGNGCSRYRKHVWAFQGLLTCAQCGCVLTAEVKKGKYVYYHCTGGRGKCNESYVREEELARQFGDALRAVHVDTTTLEYMTAALKLSHKDERQFHEEAVTQLQVEYSRLRTRMDAMYEDKLDGTVPADVFERKSQEYNERQLTILRKITQHQAANHSYIEEGAQLLEMVSRMVEKYDEQPLSEQRKLIQLVLSNSRFGGGKLIPEYRPPFTALVNQGIFEEKTQVAGHSRDLGEIWLPD